MGAEQDLYTVLVECVKAAGGSKLVGCKLWPEKEVEAAQRLLLDCLKEDRPQRLNPEQVLLVAHMAREKGCHAYMDYCAQRLHYAPPVPREPAQELAELQRQFLAATQMNAAMLAQITALMGQVPGAAGLKAVA